MCKKLIKTASRLFVLCALLAPLHGVALGSFSYRPEEITKIYTDITKTKDARKALEGIMVINDHLKYSKNDSFLLAYKGAIKVSMSEELGVVYDQERMKQEGSADLKLSLKNIAMLNSSPNMQLTALALYVTLMHKYSLDSAENIIKVSYMLIEHKHFSSLDKKTQNAFLDNTRKMESALYALDDTTPSKKPVAQGKQEFLLDEQIASVNTSLDNLKAAKNSVNEAYINYQSKQAQQRKQNMVTSFAMTTSHLRSMQDTNQFMSQFNQAVIRASGSIPVDNAPRMDTDMFFNLFIGALFAHMGAIYIHDGAKEYFDNAVVYLDRGKELLSNEAGLTPQQRSFANAVYAKANSLLPPQYKRRDIVYKAYMDLSKQEAYLPDAFKASMYSYLYFYLKGQNAQESGRYMRMASDVNAEILDHDIEYLDAISAESNLDLE